MDTLGTALGTIWLGRYTKLRWRGPVAYLAWIVAGFMLVIMGLSYSVYIVAIAGFVSGFSLAITGLIWINSLQELVPRDSWDVSHPLIILDPMCYCLWALGSLAGLPIRSVRR